MKLSGASRSHTTSNSTRARHMAFPLWERERLEHKLMNVQEDGVDIIPSNLVCTQQIRDMRDLDSNIETNYHPLFTSPLLSRRQSSSPESTRQHTPSQAPTDPNLSPLPVSTAIIVTNDQPRCSNVQHRQRRAETKDDLDM